MVASGQREKGRCIGKLAWGWKKRQKEKEKSLNLSLPLCGVGVSVKLPDQAEMNKANIKKPVHRSGHLSKTQLDKGSENDTAPSVLFWDPALAMP